MDPNLLRIAHRFQHLIDSKHQYARSIDGSNRQLIQLIIGQSNFPAPAGTKEYTNNLTKDAFHADLIRFAQAIFREMTKPLPPPPAPKKAVAVVTPSILDRALQQHTDAILAASNHIIQVVEGISQNVENIYERDY
jgi:hypothetical protein